MIVLPNSFERYLASLRIFVSLSILKHGLKPKHLKMLKKITIAEAFYNKNTLQNIDIYKLCINLFRAISTYKNHFKFHISKTNNHQINKILFSLLLLAIAKHADSCKIYATQNHIVIKSNNISKQLIAFINALGGYYLREIFTNKLAIIIPAAETKKPTVYIESEWEYIFNKFSILNIFFETII